jgi:hypothetical protein
MMLGTLWDREEAITLKLIFPSDLWCGGYNSIKRRSMTLRSDGFMDTTRNICVRMVPLHFQYRSNLESLYLNQRLKC